MTVTHSRATEKNTNKASVGKSSGSGRKKNAGDRTGSSADGTARIERALADHDWSRARSLLQEEVVSMPADHWVWLSLSLTYYEQFQYEKALTCSRRAVELAPECPLALWNFAGSLYMTGGESAAFAIWILLLNLDTETVAYGEHGEGMKMALQLQNDVQFRVGRYYRQIGQADLAREAFEKYLHNRAHGVGSIYDARTIEACMSETAS